VLLYGTNASGDLVLDDFGAAPPLFANIQWVESLTTAQLKDTLRSVGVTGKAVNSKGKAAMADALKKALRLMA